MTELKTKAPRPMHIAAIVRTGTSHADRLLRDVAFDLQRRGYRVGGAVRCNDREPGGHPCDVVLMELTTGETVSLSEMRGPHAEGCQLDIGALAHIAGLVDASLERGLDLLIVNKFGKREAQGSGMSETIVRAVESGIPVVVSVSKDHVEAWRTFSGGKGQLLTAERDPIDDWLARALGCIGAERIQGSRGT